MAKFWINFLIIFFPLFTNAFSLEKKAYEFDTLLIHDAPSQKIYVAVEKTGYLKTVGIETGVNTLVVAQKNGTFVVDPGPHRGYVEKLFDTIRTKYDTELPPVKWVFNSTAKPENVMGNYSFLKDHPTYMSSEKTRQYMLENCQACRDDMIKEIGRSELVDSEIVIPSYTFKTSSPLHPELLDWKTVLFSCVSRFSVHVVMTMKNTIADNKTANRNGPMLPNIPTAYSATKPATIALIPLPTWQ